MTVHYSITAELGRQRQQQIARSVETCRPSTARLLHTASRPPAPRRLPRAANCPRGPVRRTGRRRHVRPASSAPTREDESGSAEPAGPPTRPLADPLAGLGDRAAQPRNVGLQRKRRLCRRLIVPELVDQPVQRHQSVDVEGQQSEHGPLLAAPQPQPNAVSADTGPRSRTLIPAVCTRGARCWPSARGVQAVALCTSRIVQTPACRMSFVFKIAHADRPN